MAEVYVSTDIEADGPIPLRYSMLSFGSAAYILTNNHYEQVGTYTANLHQLAEATTHPDTMEWWKTQPEAWAACRADLQDPKLVMINYSNWLDNLPGKPVFVAYPAGYDFNWVYTYLIEFTGSSPFAWSAIDIKTYAMAMLKKEYRKLGKRAFPRRWFRNTTPHNHVALADAIEQGELFMNMLIENLTKGLNK